MSKYVNEKIESLIDNAIQVTDLINGSYVERNSIMNKLKSIDNVVEITHNNKDYQDKLILLDKKMLSILDTLEQMNGGNVDV